MIGFEEACDIILSRARPLSAEMVDLAHVHGRVLAQSVTAAVEYPPADVSAMDGYAVADADLATLPARLLVDGKVFPGASNETPLKVGSCRRIFTGGFVPAGADRVVMQENVETDGDFAIVSEFSPGSRNIRKQGFDFRRGDTLLRANIRLDHRAVVAAAGGDVSQFSCWRRPRLAVLATGDELTEPGTASTTPDTIPDSVSFGVAALAEHYGASIVSRCSLRDDLPQMERAAGKASNTADVVVVTGGASVGERDFAKMMFEPHGLELFFSKVAMKPGKPVWFGRVGNALVIGLPGNPVSAMVTARLLLAPLLLGLGGSDPQEALDSIECELNHDLSSSGERDVFHRAKLAHDRRVDIISSQDSAAQRALVDADLLLRAPAGSSFAKGEKIQAINF
ncbi:molybdopterin molybdotransferase MoeA [Aurantiacibacter sediminis]|uniref:Molybdopterin molybdenumtransferase n=1 Tax=Aurantiacibacter sediminis TaxID=2793064 RepID=A0ABS0N6L6_9SPHN|nr:molybdopterin molybdotransferase MoeA [Aurantiacibacter sediminis]MBH5323459.1 molybdopterin molybdotransferase MoeA [Aurantiacibacter sediminis]